MGRRAYMTTVTRIRMANKAGQIKRQIGWTKKIQGYNHTALEKER